MPLKNFDLALKIHIALWHVPWGGLPTFVFDRGNRNSQQPFTCS